MKYCSNCKYYSISLTPPHGYDPHRCNHLGVITSKSDCIDITYYSTSAVATREGICGFDAKLYKPTFLGILKEILSK